MVSGCSKEDAIFPQKLNISENIFNAEYSVIVNGKDGRIDRTDYQIEVFSGDEVVLRVSPQTGSRGILRAWLLGDDVKEINAYNLDREKEIIFAIP